MDYLSDGVHVQCNCNFRKWVKKKTSAQSYSKFTSIVLQDFFFGMPNVSLPVFAIT